MTTCKYCMFWESIDSNDYEYSRCEHPLNEKMKTSSTNTCRYGERYNQITEDEYSENVGALIEDAEVE